MALEFHTNGKQAAVLGQYVPGYVAGLTDLHSVDSGQARDNFHRPKWEYTLVEEPGKGRVLLFLKRL
ncbi:hypothetical protein IY73_00380 [Lawsonella clevelandensis]|uniref:Uncharacterized protein n=1 Tax=Lawsonella clevelandensis TaxID=1528099 RepID=A0A0M4LXR5_9ACTN|nr:hypothetical protein AL705_00365 [Lawsonella clevelandensis]ALE34088.1 hypothetical protein IY73_00380 [Lawsonella clevelandensis]